MNPKGAAHIMGYSHGLKVDIGNAEMIFVTGQIAVDEKGDAVAPGDFGRQTEYIFDGIARILREGDASLDDVVKAVIYITDTKRYGDVSAVRNRYFADSKPVSTLVEISNTVKEGCDLEIEVMAVRSK